MDGVFIWNRGVYQFFEFLIWTRFRAEEVLDLVGLLGLLFVAICSLWSMKQGRAQAPQNEQNKGLISEEKERKLLQIRYSSEVRSTSAPKLSLRQQRLDESIRMALLCFEKTTIKFPSYFGKVIFRNTDAAAQFPVRAWSWWNFVDLIRTKRKVRFIRTNTGTGRHWDHLRNNDGIASSQEDDSLPELISPAELRRRQADYPSPTRGQSIRVLWRE